MTRGRRLSRGFGHAESSNSNWILVVNRQSAWRIRHLRRFRAASRLRHVVLLGAAGVSGRRVD
jgi:hypothetical protein